MSKHMFQVPIVCTYQRKDYISLQHGCAVDADGEEFRMVFSKTGVKINRLGHYTGSVEIDLAEIVEAAIVLLKREGKMPEDGE